MTELIGIDRKAGHAGKLMQKVKNFGIDPRRFSVTKGIESVKSHLHPVKQRDALDVIDRDAVLYRQTRMVGAQGQTPLWRQTPQENLHASSRVRLKNVTRIAAGCAVQFAIADGENRAREIQNFFALRARKFASWQQRRT